MWVLRNSKRFRVDFYMDPCWNKLDRKSAINKFIHYIESGLTDDEAISLATVTIWKQKWSGTIYNDIIETKLKNTII